MPQKYLNYLLFILLGSLWGGSFIGIKIVVEAFPPFFGAMLRVAVGLLPLLILRLAKKPAKLPFSILMKFWIISLFAIGFPFMFLFWGEQLISPGLAGILNGTVPLWVFIISLVVLHHSHLWQLKNIIGLFLGLLGVIIIFWPMLQLDNSATYIFGGCLILGMAISYAIGALLMQNLLAKEKEKIDLFTNLYQQHWGAVVFLLTISLACETWPTATNFFVAKDALLASLYLGLFSTALGWLIYYYLIREWGAVQTSTVTYLAPIMALFWDFLFFQHQPKWNEFLGITTILLGVITIRINFKNFGQKAATLQTPAPQAILATDNEN